MADTHDPMRCPKCHATMQAGFLPVSKGMCFIRGDGKAASSFAEDLPGTYAVMRSNKLIAWRCKACEMVIFKYGRDNAKRIARLLDEDTLIEQQSIELIKNEDEAKPSTRRSNS